MIVCTRDSELALAQTTLFCEAMKSANPEVELEIMPMKSSGDLDLTSSLDAMQGFGAFVRELDAAVKCGKADVSVNSMKDMPIDIPEELFIAAVLPRASTDDVSLPVPLDKLPVGAKVGTSSIRRAAQLRAFRPDLQILPLRGNVRTRLSKLDSGSYDAIILAKAGMDRLGETRPMFPLPRDKFITAPAQGAIAVVCRKDDEETIRLVSSINDEKTWIETDVERRIMRLLGAGCSSPVGIRAELNDNEVKIDAVYFVDESKSNEYHGVVSADADDAELEKISKILKGE